MVVEERIYNFLKDCTRVGNEEALLCQHLVRESRRMDGQHCSHQQKGRGKGEGGFGGGGLGWKGKFDSEY
tara:strand:+ start:270 stop:479 length:210 start_codon:yes stop_codon:yes gene_type:complete